MHSLRDMNTIVREEEVEAKVEGEGKEYSENLVHVHSLSWVAPSGKSQMLNTLE